MTDPLARVTELAAYVEAWLDLELSILERLGKVDKKALRAEGKSRQEVREILAAIKAEGDPFRLTKDASKGLVWNCTGMYSLLKVPLAGRDRFMSDLRRRRLFKVAVHQHDVLGEIAVAYTDEFQRYPESYARRMVFVPGDGCVVFVGSAEDCSGGVQSVGCFGTGLVDGYKPEGGPHPTSGVPCPWCHGEGWVHGYGFDMGSVGPSTAVVRLDTPERWLSQAAHERD